MTRRPTLAVRLGLVGLLVVATPVGKAAAQSKDSEEAEASNSESDDGPPDAWREAFDRGDEAYENEKFRAAEKALVEAVQAAPRHPRTYLALARTYFQQEKYARAVAYYDFYLKLAGGEKGRAQKERRLAAHRAGSSVWKLPETQKRVSDALRERLAEGDAYTEGGGGAWGLYETLLRTGYAKPELARLRERLRRKLLDEFDATVDGAPGQPMPTLELSDWKLQRERLEAARELVREPSEREAIDRRATIVDAAVALVNGRAERAAGRASEALEANPDLRFLRWLRVVALVEMSNYAEAREELDGLREELDDAPERLQQYADYLASVIDRHEGEADTATERYWKWLRQ